MNYLSVCSGIEAATVAWHPLGWRPAGFSEIEPFPSAVLAHHYPDVPNHGDFTTLLRNPPAGVDVLVGGTPCQAFSVAGLRGGLSDPRGNLALAFVALVGVLRPRWVVWENVPGVLSSGGGRDFGSFLGGLGELGYGWAYRVLDAQYFGLAQRRQRVFVVASPGDWRRAAAVLFEPEGVRRDSPPRRETRSGVAGAVTRRAGSGGPDDNTAQAGQVVPCGGGEVEVFQCHGSNVGPMGTMRKGSGSVTGGVPFLACPDVSPAIKARDFKGPGSFVGDSDGAALIAHTLRAEGHDASEDGTGRGVPIVPVAYNIHAAESGAKGRHAYATEYARCLDGKGGFSQNQGGTVVHSIQEDNQNGVIMRDIAGTVRSTAPGSQQGGSLALVEPMTFDWQAGGGGADTSFRGGSRSWVCDKPGRSRALTANKVPATFSGQGVRRLMPHELERLQGFPDDYTRIPYRSKSAEDCPDGPRAKALGNSMAVPVMRWIGERIALVETTPLPP